MEGRLLHNIPHLYTDIADSRLNRPRGPGANSVKILSKGVWFHQYFKDIKSFFFVIFLMRSPKEVLKISSMKKMLRAIRTCSKIKLFFYICKTRLVKHAKFLLCSSDFFTSPPSLRDGAMKMIFLNTILGYSESWRASKLHLWFTNYNNFAEFNWVVGFISSIKWPFFTTELILTATNITSNNLI